MKTNALSLILISLITCFASLRPAEALDPPPDGGYRGGNTAEGSNALFRVDGGAHNTAVGDSALKDNMVGDNNTATGYQSLFSNREKQNTATGALALRNNEFGKGNTATGFQTLLHNTNGGGNTATGQSALEDNITGNDNTAIGLSALLSNTTGRNNTAAGSQALFHNTTGSFNVALGAGAGSGVITANDVICIGRGVAGANVNGTCFIGNIHGVQTQNANALPVVIDGAGQLGTVASSERFKKDIATMGQASEGILSLRPVTFHYKKDTMGTAQFGLIAEEVAKVNPALVVADKEGKPYTVRYDAVNAMLLNEFLKARRQIDAQQKQIEALTAGLQKVSAQLEVSKTAPQTVLNDQ